MALYNEIQVGRYNGILHKLLGMKEGAPSPQLSGDVVPALILESERAEWAYLAGTKLMVGHASLAASVGNVGNVQCWVPSGSNVVVTIDRIYFGCVTSKEFYISWSTVALTTQSVAASRDSRNGIGVIIGAAHVRYQFAAAPLGTGSIMKFNAGSGFVAMMDVPFVITPGFGIIVSNTVQNSEMSVNFAYRERTLEPSELR